MEEALPALRSNSMKTMQIPAVVGPALLNGRLLCGASVRRRWNVRRDSRQPFGGPWEAAEGGLGQGVSMLKSSIAHAACPNHPCRCSGRRCRGNIIWLDRGLKVREGDENLHLRRRLRRTSRRCRPASCRGLVPCHLSFLTKRQGTVPPKRRPDAVLRLVQGAKADSPRQ